MNKLYTLTGVNKTPSKVSGKSVVTPSKSAKSSNSTLLVYSGDICRTKFKSFTLSDSAGADTKLILLVSLGIV